MTRGLKSSEYKLAQRTFLACFIMSLYGIFKGVDLMGLAALVTALGTVATGYGYNRSKVKAGQGEDVR